MKELITVLKILEEMKAYSGGNSTYSISHSLQGNILEIKYSTVVHFASEQSLQQQTLRLKDASAQLINETLANLKSAFRDAEGKTLKTEEVGGTDDLELLSATSNSPRKISYYKNRRNFELTV